MTSIITSIVKGAVNLWNEVKTDVEADAAKIKSALAADAHATVDKTVAIVKQGASDAIALSDSAIQKSLPPIASSVEAALDAELATLSGGMSLVAVPLVHKGIEDLESFAASVVHAWALKAKASLAPAAAPHG